MITLMGKRDPVASFFRIECICKVTIVFSNTTRTETFFNSMFHVTK